MTTDIEIANRLAHEGYTTVPQWLAPSDVEELKQWGRKRRASFKAAGVGRGRDHQLAEEIRNDEIYWLGQEAQLGVPRELEPTESRLLRRLEELRVTLNRELFLGLESFEAHLAVYPPGGFYQRHLDRFRSDDARTVSAVIYLNPHWSSEDGGALRLFPKGAGVITVEPRGGTLVVFMSAEIEHEVSESFRERWSIACWFRRSANRPRT